VHDDHIPSIRRAAMPRRPPRLVPRLRRLLQSRRQLSRSGVHDPERPGPRPTL
jgi:hypothetical protein